MKGRVSALDWMRGIVMVLMAIDHASASYNAGRLVTDSVWLYTPGTSLPAAQFFTRWISHLCAPTFLFLAGSALALSVARRTEGGQQAWDIDRDLLVRGCIILALDPLFISWIWPLPGGSLVLFQVLYAIGASFVFMVPLRRLGTRGLAALGAGLLVFGEALSGLAMVLGGGPTSLGALLLYGGPVGPVLVAYPVLPWLGMMLLGWAFGNTLLNEDASPVKLLTGTGITAVLGFVVVRGLNGYGNVLLLREDSSVVQWLHCSKYPPSLTFSLLELGLMSLLLAGLFVLQGRLRQVNRLNPLLVFGQTALFFYLLHIPLLQFSAEAGGVVSALGLGATYLAALVVLLVLYPLCLWYRGYKAAHRDSWVRFF